MKSGDAVECQAVLFISCRSSGQHSDPADPSEQEQGRPAETSSLLRFSGNLPWWIAARYIEKKTSLPHFNVSHVTCVIFIYIDVPCTRRVLVYNIYIYNYIYTYIIYSIYITYIITVHMYTEYMRNIHNLHIMSDHPRGLDASQYPSCKGGPRVWNPWQTSGTGVPRGDHRVYRNGYRKKWPYVNVFFV